MNSIFSLLPTKRTIDQLGAGELVTVELRKSFNSSEYVQCGARIEKIECGNAFVKLVGLEVPAPYQIGDRLPLDVERVIDWYLR